LIASQAFLCDRMALWQSAANACRFINGRCILYASKYPEQDLQKKRLRAPQGFTHLCVLAACFARQALWLY